MSQSLYCAIRDANKADKYRLKDLWEFRVAGETPTTACRRAFSDLCQKNQGRLSSCFDRWLSKPQERRDFHPIHNTDADWQHFSMSVSARGLFGIVTIGVHLSIYSVRKFDGREIVDRIRVSQRATSDHTSYSGMLDQVVAGGMDPTDHVNGILSPGHTLMRFITLIYFIKG
ncbi:hypothetical protein BGZ63DRAFT_427061 [Mariannaea sp. PMI_226]|nr:hypothetical protein BGZ63DRAFT_427061 [Mariannaea sp. PMI_226]